MISGKHLMREILTHSIHCWVVLPKKTENSDTIFSMMEHPSSKNGAVSLTHMYWYPWIQIIVIFIACLLLLLWQTAPASRWGLCHGGWKWSWRTFYGGYKPSVSPTWTHHAPYSVPRWGKRSLRSSGPYCMRILREIQEIS